MLPPIIPIESRAQNLVMAKYIKNAIIKILIMPYFKFSTIPRSIVIIQANPKYITNDKGIPESCPKVGSHPIMKPNNDAIKVIPTSNLAIFGCCIIK
jgi:hypothetical protein